MSLWKRPSFQTLLKALDISSASVWVALDLLKALVFVFLLRFTLCKTEQPLEGMELQEKENQKDRKS